MGLQGPIPVEFAHAFPRGAFAAGGFEPVRDFEASKAGRFVQAKDKASGLPVWVVEVIDADPQARDKTARVKIAAPDQPVLPAPGPGMPFVPVEFTGLAVTPYVSQAGRLGYSLRATGVRVPGSVDLDGQCMTIDRTASESGGRRDVREDMKTRAAVRTVVIPDIAMPAVRRLVERGEEGRARSDGRLYAQLINGDRGGYLGYATWRKYLTLAHGYTAAQKDGPVKYTAHELRHVCASLLIASGASDMKVAHQMGHSKVETTKNIYGHLFAQDRASILEAMNEAVSRLHAYESTEAAEDQAA